MIRRIVVPPYDGYDLSTFVIHDNTVHIGHFGGSIHQSGKVLTTAEEQMQQTLDNLQKALREINLGLENVIKLTVILKHIGDFHQMHRVWVKYFSKHNFPVRTVVTSDFVDDHCLLQIEGIAACETE